MKRKTTFVIEKSLHTKFMRKCKYEGKVASKIVEELIRFYVNDLVGVENGKQ